MDFWKAKNKDKLQKILSELLKLTTNRGVSLTPYTEIMFQELSYACNYELYNSDIIKICFKLKANSLFSLSDFEKEYITVHRNISEEPCKIFSPYSNDILQTEFKILGHEFKVISSKELREQIDCSALLKMLKNNQLNEINIDDKYFIITNSTGNTIFNAWDFIKDKVSVLQGINDFLHTRNDILLTQLYSPLTKFNHPEWIVADCGNNKFHFGSFGSTVTKKNYSFDLMATSRSNPIFELVKDYENDGTTKNSIIDCFRLFGQALESIHKNNFYLSLWQLIERATNSESFGGKTEKIISRVEVIVNDMRKGELKNLHFTYFELASKRNAIVHRGVDNLSTPDLNIIKILSETCIDWLIHYETNLKTSKHIEEYFRHKTTSDSDKKILIETLGFLSGKKNKDSV